MKINLDVSCQQFNSSTANQLIGAAGAMILISQIAFSKESYWGWTSVGALCLGKSFVKIDLKKEGDSPAVVKYIPVKQFYKSLTPSASKRPNDTILSEYQITSSVEGKLLLNPIIKGNMTSMTVKYLDKGGLTYACFNHIAGTPAICLQMAIVKHYYESVKNQPCELSRFLTCGLLIGGDRFSGLEKPINGQLNPAQASAAILFLSSPDQSTYCEESLITNLNDIINQNSDIINKSVNFFVHAYNVNGEHSPACNETCSSLTSTEFSQLKETIDQIESLFDPKKQDYSPYLKQVYQNIFAFKQLLEN
jgi:hypothetical protein